MKAEKFATTSDFSAPWKAKDVNLEMMDACLPAICGSKMVCNRPVSASLSSVKWDLFAFEAGPATATET
jgi:hypothetical protein